MLPGYRFSRLSMFSLFLALLVAFLPRIHAQTAHFSHSTASLGSGLSHPEGVAVDGSGNVYIADSSDGRVLKEALQPDGSYTQSTIASGLSYPADVAVDGSGNVYIADSGHGSVLKETLSASSYTQSTIASGMNDPQGVAVDGSGNVYIADSGDAQVLKETLSAGSYTKSTIGSGLSWPKGVAVDGSGNVYIADNLKNVALKETLSAGSYTQSTIVSGLNHPGGVAVDRSGNVYIADSDNNRVLKETLSGGSYTLSTIASGLNGPWTVAVDGSGNNVYIADTNNNRVLKEQFGGVSFGAVKIGSPSSAKTLIFKFDTQGRISVPEVGTMGWVGLDFNDAGTGSCDADAYNSTVLNAGDTCSVDVTFQPTYAWQREGAVELTNLSGAVIATAYVYGTGEGPQVAFLPGTQSTIGSGLSYPWDVAADGIENVYIPDWGNNRVLQEALQSDGSYTQQSTVIGSGLKGPSAAAVDGAGDVYIADTGNGRVLKETLQPDGSFTQSTVKSGLSAPSGVAVDGSGNVYIADTGFNLVLKEALHPDGSYTQSTIGSSLSSPEGVAVDGSGNVYIGDTANNRVLKETLQHDGSYTQSTIGSGINQPGGVAVDGAGNVYIPDWGNSRVLQETLQHDGSYTQSTIGSGLYHPSGVAVDGSGNVYIADHGHNRVLEENHYSVNDLALQEHLPDAPSLTFATTEVGSTSTDSPQTVTLENIGNKTLTFPLPTAGNNPSVSADFAWDSASTCTQTDTRSSLPLTLAAGASCTAAIDFSPTTAGTVSGSVVLTDDSLNAASPNYTTQSIGLSGTAEQLAISPASLPKATVGTSYSVQLSASGGTSPYTFTVSGLPAGLSFDTTTNKITGAPTAEGISIVTIQVTDNLGTSYSDLYTLQVNAPATQTALTSSPNPSTYGQSVTLTAMVTSTAGTPDGTVNFKDGGTSLGTGTLNSGVATLSTTALAAGSDSLTAVYEGNTNYATSTSNTVTQTVSTATATVSLSNLTQTYTGSPLPVTVTTNPANLSVSVTYNGSTTAPANVGTYTVAATVTDPNYTGSANGSLTISKATATVSLSNLTQTYTGSPLQVTVTTNPANLSVSVTYNGSTTVPANVGSYTVAATVTDPNYSGSANGTLTVTQASPVITWSTPTAITYGTPLSATQLDATATYNGSTVAGKFAYTPASGTVLGAGTQTLSVAFTPTDTTDYKTATGSVSLTVNTAPLKITADNKTKVYGTANPSFTGSVTGAVNGDTFTESFSTTATITSDVGTYSITPSVTGTNLSDYTVTKVNGTLTITKATTTIAISNIPAAGHVGGTYTLTYSYTGDGTPSVSSGTPATCTVSGALVTFVGAGTCTLTASATAGTNYQATTGSAQPFNVLPVQSISVTPVDPSLANGDTLQFTAAGHYSDGYTLDLTDVAVWTSSKTNSVTISPTGLATGVKSGTSTIAATLGVVSGSTVVNETGATLVSIAVTPVNQTISTGGSLQFAATGTYSDGTTKTLTSSVTWISANTSAATIDKRGVATGIAAGTSTITAALGGVSGSTTLTVQAALVSITISPANPTVAAGTSQQLLATGTYTDGSTGDITGSVQWTSSKDRVATVSSTGVVTAVAPGRANIKATLGGINDVTQAYVPR